MTKTDKAAVIARAREYFGTWPENLTSGVMFFEGQKITQEEFLDDSSANTASDWDVPDSACLTQRGRRYIWSEWVYAKFEALREEVNQLREALEAISSGDESLGGKKATAKELRDIASHALKANTREEK